MTVVEGWPLLGYADPWSVAPGERIRFMVSCDDDRYRAELVRLFHGDDRPGAPGLKERSIASPIDGEYVGVAQPIRTGSHVLVDDGGALDLRTCFTLCAWILPTTPEKGPQGLLTRWSGDTGNGYALVIDAQGGLGLRIGSEDGFREVSSGATMRGGCWYFVAATCDLDRGVVRLLQRPFPNWPLDDSDAEVEERVDIDRLVTAGDVPFVFGGWASAEGDRERIQGHYNGRIESPAVYGGALDSAALEELAADRSEGPRAHSRASWDLSVDIPTDLVRDTSGNGLDGHAVNMPARGVTGHRYRGDEQAWVHSDSAHGAIHFHEDDLEDCHWEIAFELQVPDEYASGVYAVRLSVGDTCYRVPFFVRPSTRGPTAPILFLAPTNSYLAYANFREDFAERHGVLGLYHFHSDGSPVLYSSSRRPIVNHRPGATFDILGEDGAPHQFNADLHLVDWLTEKGFDFDIATDHDLDSRGTELLSPYRVVLTGSHPEYWTGDMLDALEGYLAGGGRLMYLGGNGLVHVTSFDPERHHVIEVRRSGPGLRGVEAGEGYHSTTGEQGGYWGERGRPPHRLLGVGSVAQGFDRSSPYRWQRDGSDPRAEWIFDGVDQYEPIGDFGLTMGGAAGFEVDRADSSSGTPPHALIVASATEFSPTYEHQNPLHVAGTDVDQHDPIRCDMVYFETANAGAVFSVGSIAYCGALSHNDYDNNVSTITENVLNRFMSS